MILNKNLLEIIKSFLNFNFEICGCIKEAHGGRIIFEVHSQDETKIGSDKLMCEHLSYSRHIFHTHPNISKCYPSAKDIIKVMKNSMIMSSIIFCKWGVWEIYSNKKYSFSLSEKQIENDKINKLLVELYEMTGKGRANEVDYKKINKCVKKIEDKYKSFGLEINLTQWEDEYEITYK